MSSTVTLPTELRARLGAVARRVRLLRALRGLSLLAVVLGLAAGAAFTADYFLHLAPVARAVLLSGWWGLGIAALMLGIVLPLSRRLDLDGLAALVEERYPQLAERLLSSVDLSRTADEGNGDQALIARLIADTDRATSRLDLLAAVPGRGVRLLAVAALATLVVLALPSSLMPRTMARLAVRFFLPLNPVPAPYNLAVMPGDVGVAKGETLEISVTVTPESDQEVPGDCTLVFQTTAGKESRMTLTGDNGVFRTSFPVSADFTYRAEAGGVSSPTYQVRAVEDLYLAANSPVVEVILPAYARGTRNAELTPAPVVGLIDLAPVLRHSEVHISARFTRPTVAASLVWHEGRWFESQKTVTLPLTLNEDRTGGSVLVPVRAAARFEIVLEAENGVRIQVPGSACIPVRDDQPPTISRVTLSDKVGVVRAAPGFDTLKIDATLGDDVAPQRAVLEVRVGKDETSREFDLKFEDVDLKPEALLAQGFKLGPLALKDGDEVRYRIRVEDGLPPEMGGPHRAYYPAREWLKLKIDNKARTANEQEIEQQRDEIRRRLEAVLARLTREERRVYKVMQDGKTEPNLNIDLKKLLDEARKDNSEVKKELEAIGRLTDPIPELQQLGDLVRELADQELLRAGQEQDAATRQKAAAPRTDNLRVADQELLAAQEKLRGLEKLNDKLAQERLDQARLEALAEHQQQLADRALALLEKDTVRDPEAAKEAEKLKEEQRQVAEELKKLTQESESLRAALDQIRADQAQALADKARDLAQAERDLARDMSATEQQRAAERLADLARKQQDLADKARQLESATRQQAAAAKTKPLDPAESARAAEALRRGDPEEAVRDQDKAAQDLERLANAFDKAADLSRDPREAARQLATLQDDLLKRTQAEMQKQDPRPLGERLEALKAEEDNIRRAADRLSVPQGKEQARKAASDKADQAARSLADNEGKKAIEQMEQTRTALNRLADELPDLAQRERMARDEVARLRQKQDQLTREIEQAQKQAAEKPRDAQAQAQLERQMAQAARVQAEIAETLSRLDVPKQEERKERVQAALDRALADLLDHRKEDVPASQQEARRQLERLDQALRGDKPADEKARELARQQRDLANEAAHLAQNPAQATPQQQQELQRRQADVARATQELQTPEAPQRQAEAAQATKQADQAAQKQPANPETAQKLDQAARKLEELSRQLSGQETDAARAERLARQQADAAAQTEREARERPNQPVTPEAQRRQDAINQEARQLRGGEEARAEKQKAADALQRAQQAPPDQRAQAQRQAADALRDLADKLAGRNDPAARAAELAREQRELAQQAGQQNPQQTPQEARQAARAAADRQAELNRQLERGTPGDMSEARQQAQARMQEARQALERAGNPAEAQQALNRAADATQQLAQQLAQQQAANPPAQQPQQSTSAKPLDPSPQKAAQQLAQAQRDLAQATRQAQEQARQQQGPAAQQALQQQLQQLAQKQEELNRQATRLPADGNQRTLEQAREAMNQAQSALQRNDANQANQKQNEAAQALDRLGQKLPAQAQAQAPRPDPAEANPQALPTREQADQARQLAREQRELREAVQRSNEAARARDNANPANPADLARQQADLARQQADLARQVGQERGPDSAQARQAQQAQQAARQAAEQAQSGALPQAQQSGAQSAEQLRQLGRDLQQSTPQGNPPSPNAERAADLARRQEDLNRQFQQANQDRTAQRAEQQQRQADLQRQTNDLAQNLQRLGNEMPATPQGQQPGQQAQQAGQQAQQAAQAMQQARDQAREGNPNAARQSQEQAAQALDRAAQQAAQAARQAGQQQQARNQPMGQPMQGQPMGNQQGQPMGNQQGQPMGGQPMGGQPMGGQPMGGQPMGGQPMGGQPMGGQPMGGQPMGNPGQQTQQAQGQIQQAQGQLNQGQTQQAQGSMQQAAQSLQQAAQSLQNQQGQQQGRAQQPGKPTNPSQPGEFGAQGGGVPDASLFARDDQKYVGTEWGKLPGEVRTRIVQQLQVRYGDDQAQMIKLYFEQVAGNKKK